MAEIIRDLLAPHAAGLAGDPGAGPAAAGLRRPARARRRHRGDAGGAGHRPQRPGRLSCCPTGRRWPRPSSPSPVGATTAPLNPGLPCRRARLLPYRPPGQGARGPGRHGRAGRRGGRRHGQRPATCTPPPTARRPAGSSCSRRKARPRPRRARWSPAGSDDVALVLHTSGTTSRPKIVPLPQRNLAASARHIGTTLALTPEDRCLNIMPLFHIHGLIAAVLSSLSAGARSTAPPASTPCASSTGW